MEREPLGPSPFPYPADMLEFREEFPGIANLMPGTEIRFRDVGIKPVDLKDALPPEEMSPRFRKLVLDGMFRSEAVTAADVNQEGNISFVQHTIMDDFADPTEGGVTFAALHALTLADVDGDGLLDVVTGKRWWAHFGENPSDPDAFGPPVLYWFRLEREGEGGARFVPDLINNHSGVGTDMSAVDLTGNGLADVLTSTRFGTFIFLNEGDPSASE